MNNYAVLHVEKCKPNTYALGRHISRETTPSNADPSKAHENVIIVDHHNNLMKAIDQRINEGYKGKTAIRKDAVKSISVVMTGSHEHMALIKEHGSLKDWTNSNYRFLCERYGKENIVSMALHMDERTPHIHAVIVPLTHDGRLSAKDVVGNKSDLKRLQDDYAKKMSIYGLTRGEEGSRARHEDVAEYYKRVNTPVMNKFEYENKLFESKETLLQRVATPLLQKIQEQDKKIKDLNDNIKRAGSTLKCYMDEGKKRSEYEKILNAISRGEIQPERLRMYLEQKNILETQNKAPKIDSKGLNMELEAKRQIVKNRGLNLGFTP